MKLLNDISNLGFSQIIVMGSFLTGVFYFTIYDKGEALIRQINVAKKEFQKTEKSLKEKQDELNRLIQFEKDLNIDEKAIDVFLDYIPKEMTTVEMFRFITQEAKISGINIEDKSDYGSEEKEMVHAIKASLKISGSFPQVVFFLSKLTAQKRILLVDRITIEKEKESETVVASMDIYAFRYKQIVPKEGNKQEEGS